MSKNDFITKSHYRTKLITCPSPYNSTHHYSPSFTFHSIFVKFNLPVLNVRLNAHSERKWKRDITVFWVVYMISLIKCNSQSIVINFRNTVNWWIYHLSSVIKPRDVKDDFVCCICNDFVFFICWTVHCFW